jgi:hypothetical protein
LDNAAIEAAKQKAEMQLNQAKQEQKKQLAKQIQKVQQTPGLFYAAKSP